MTRYSNPQPSMSGINFIFHNKKFSFVSFKVSDVPIGMFTRGSLTASDMGVVVFLSKIVISFNESVHPHISVYLY